MQTVLQELKENLEQQIKVVEKQTEHKFGAMWGLNMAILSIELLLKKEQEQLEASHRAGQRNAGIDPSSHSALAYFLETFKND